MVRASRARAAARRSRPTAAQSLLRRPHPEDEETPARLHVHLVGQSATARAIGGPKMRPWT
ncbi:hypothetical protein [Streptomyces sp. NPDC059863]|uniref:hypothetical protein n=1 Tax=unclassified Streptomyces TaxID=2593676 RepID=UPI0036555B7E